MASELTRDKFEHLKEGIASRDSQAVLATVYELYPADLARLLQDLEEDEMWFVLSLTDTTLTAEVIDHLDKEFRKKVLREYSSEEIAALLAYIDSDDAVDILNEQPLTTREEVIELIDDPEKAGYILDLLHYEPDCAGGLMAKELLKCNVNWKVEECVELLREKFQEVEKINYVYVIDNKDRLLGTVELTQLILSEKGTTLSEIYNPNVVSVETYRHEQEIASIMRKYDIDAIPVVNVHGKLVGRITIDDIVDVITEQAESERKMMSGISEDIEAGDTVWRLSRARLPWLLIGIAGGLLGAEFIGIFEDDLAMIPAMAFFIPLITATGGNVGIQSSSLVVQSLADESFLAERFGKRFYKVVTVALLNGIIISGLVYIFSLATLKDMRLAMVVSIALFCVVLLSSFFGTFVPLLLNKLGVNPAMASGPFITTLNDLLGIGVYFMTAHLLY